MQAPLFNIYGEDVVCRPGGVDPVVREDSDLRTTSKKKKTSTPRQPLFGRGTVLKPAQGVHRD